jgi:hypothetical protein
MSAVTILCGAYLLTRRAETREAPALEGVPAPVTVE